MENTKAMAVEPVRPQRKKINLQIILPLVIPVMLIVVWQLSATLGMVSNDISPVAIFQDAVSLTQSGTLPQNISVSLYRALIGFAIGGSIGLVLGFINGISSWSRNLLDSSVQMLRNIPHLSLIPLVIMVFGIGETAKISLVAVGVMFPVYINTFQGIKSVDSDLIEMGRSYGLSKWQLLTKVIIPGALPSIFNGIRYALGVMWTTLIVAETISSSSGIGYMANNAQDYMDITTVLLCIIIYAILGKVSDLIAKLLESIFLDWQKVKGGVAND